MKIESGHPVTKDIAPVEGNSVRFVTDDGRTMLEVIIGKDKRSIEILGIETTKIDGVLYGTTLQIEPRASNSVVIRPAVY